MSDPTGISRRNFFGAGVTAGTLAALGAAVPMLGSSVTAAAADSRTYAGAILALEVDGTHAGFVSGAEGGGLAAQLLEFPLGTTGVPRPQITSFDPVPLTIAFSSGIAAKVLDWFTARDFSARSVDLVLGDASGNEIFRLSLRGARVLAFGMGKLDATSNEQLEFQVTLTADQTFQQLGGKGKITGLGLKQKQIRVNSFRFFIQGLESSTQMTSRIEALSVRAKVTETSVGTQRSPSRSLAGMIYDNVVAKVALATAGPLYQWSSDFIAAKGTERAGQIQLLAPDGKPMVTIDLLGMRPLRVATPFASLNTSETAPSIKLELQPAEIRFNLKDLAG